MGSTLVEKILAAHAGRKSVGSGEEVTVKVDLVLANDITAPLAIKEFQKMGAKRVFDPQRVVFVPDHFVPAKDVPSAEQAKLMKEFAREQGAIYFEVGRVGIEHVLLPEQGLALPGDVILGADSHTCTYGALGAFAMGLGSTDIARAMASGEIQLRVPPTMRFLYHGRLRPWVTAKDLILYTIGRIGVDGALNYAMEFGGEVMDRLSMDGRFTVANMVIEAGADAGIFRVDATTLEYVRPRAQRPFTIFESDPDATYADTVEIDVSSLEPQVAFPPLPSDSRPLSQVGEVRIDQAVIGSCTNGRLEDLRLAAQVLQGRQVHQDVRCIIIPGSPQVYLQAMKEGLLEDFIRAGAVVSPPTCGPCLGGYMGVLAAGERAIATTNRNFVGRMGSRQAEVYLASPAVVAASAILGRIGGPEEALSIDSRGPAR